MNISKNNTRIYKVALYIRLSKEDGDKEESESITNQRKILNSYLKDNPNFVLYDEYVDDGYSGTNFNRPAFKRMIQDIEEKNVNMVITKSLSRLGRDYIETGRYMETYFPEHEVRYISLLDDIDTELDKNCETAAFINIMNDFYAKETSKNIKKTKNRKKKEGFFYISYAPFGYNKIDIAGNLEINRDEAKLVQRIFKLFLDGKGTYQIAELLNKEEILPPGMQKNMKSVMSRITNTTNKWRHGTIKNILTNKVYIGCTVQNKTRKISYKSKKLINLPEEEYTIMENHHEAIIDKYTFDLVQNIFKCHKKEKIMEEGPLLKPLLYCSHCHNKLSVIKKQDKYKEKITERCYVICSTATRKISNKSCYKRYINYDKLENIILSKVTYVIKQYLYCGAFNDKNVLDKMIEITSNKGNLEKELEKIQSELENVNKKIKILYSDKLNGMIEGQDYMMFYETLQNERKKLDDLQIELQKEIIEFDNKETSMKIRNEMKEILKDIVENGNYSKDIIYQLINRIDIDKDNNILIHFNFYELNCLGGIEDEQEKIC